MRIVDGQQVLGRSAGDQDDDVGFGGPVYDREPPPILNGALHGTDRVPTFGKQVRVELISVVGGNVDIARIRQSRKLITGSRTF